MVYSTGPECTLCQHALDVLAELRARVAPHLDLRVLETELSTDRVDDAPEPPSASDFLFRVPVVMVGEHIIAEGRIARDHLVAALSAVNSSFARAVVAIPSNAPCGPGAPFVDENI